MKENENKEQSKTAGAARQGGDTSKETIGSPVSTAVGEPVATADDQWIFDLAAEHEARGNGLYGPVTFDATGLVNFAQAVAARLAAPTQVSAPQADDRWKLDAEKLADGIHDAAVKCGLLGFGTSITGPQCLMLLDTLVEMAKGAPQAVPEVLLNAKAVYDELYKTSSCSSLEEVSDVLDAIVRLIRADAPQASAAQEVRAVPELVLAPKWAGYFHSYQDWVNKAQSRLASPDHRRAMCVDAKGRRCAIGKDFMLARDEGAFPVRYFWECELVPASTSTAPAAMDEKGGAA